MMCRPLEEKEKTKDLFVPAILLMIAAFCVFANTFGNGWTYDDFPVIVENLDVRSIQAFFSDSYPGRPLREVTFLLDYALFGLKPAGWHFQNVFWHGLNAGLLFTLVRRLGGDKGVAWIASLLFLLHPIQVEVVANISHRKDSLALAFCLLALLAYIRVFRSSKRRAAWLLIAAAAAWVAYQGKENAAVLPCMFLAYELVHIPSQARFLLRKKRVVAGVLAAGGVVAVGWFFWGGGLELHQAGIQGLLQKADFFSTKTEETYFLLVFKSWTFLFLKLIWPSNLGAEYIYPVPASWGDPWVVAALLGLAIYGALLLLSFRRQPLLFFGLLWFGLFWLPTSNLWPLSYFSADRYLYAPSVGFFIVVAFVLRRFLPRPVLLAAFMLPVFLALSTLTWQQNRVWRSSESLWTQAYKVSPRSSFVLNNLGNVYLLKGRLVSAIKYYTMAAEVNPNNPTAQYNLGLIYEKMGDKEKALEYYGSFLSLDAPLFRAQAQALRQRLTRQYGVDFH